MDITNAKEVFSYLLSDMNVQYNANGNSTLKPLSKDEQLNIVVEAAKQVFVAIIKLDDNSTEEEKVTMVTQLENLGEVNK